MDQTFFSNRPLELPKSALKFRRLSRFLPPASTTAKKSVTSSWRATLVVGTTLVVCSSNIRDVIQPNQEQASTKAVKAGVDEVSPMTSAAAAAGAASVNLGVETITGLQTCLFEQLRITQFSNS